MKRFRMVEKVFLNDKLVGSDKARVSVSDSGFLYGAGLFETEDGWNQVGGPDMVTSENHSGEGCNIFFNGGHVTFNRPKHLEESEWKVKEGEE